MNSIELKKLDKQYVADTYSRNDLCISCGKGAACYSPEGKRYIDFSSGIGVNSLGFCDESWVEAVTAQAKTLQHVSNLFYTEPCVELASMLLERTGLKKIFFANSGAEANEGAIKTARKYSNVKYAKNPNEEGNDSGRTDIIAMENSFHGRTMTTITATGQDAYHKNFHPFAEGFTHVKVNDISDFKSKVSDKTCAVMLEFVQGEGGVIVLNAEFIKEIARICEEKDILIIADEVQTGIGRTGKFFAYEHFGIKPDLVTVAKGLGGGLPIGGVLFGNRTADVLTPGDHGTTFGGNPIVCAGGVAVLKKINEAFLKEVSEKGNYIKKKISEMGGVKSVSGLGMMLGIETDGTTAKTVVSEAMENGLLLLTAKEKVRLLPPLSIEYDEIDEGLAILERALKKQ